MQGRQKMQGRQRCRGGQCGSKKCRVGKDVSGSAYSAHSEPAGRCGVGEKKCRVGKKSQGRQESQVGADDDDGVQVAPRWILWVPEGSLGREQ